MGTGQNGGVAVDDGGTIYVGWQVNVGDPGDGVQLCVVPPRTTRCASSVTIPFPGSGYNASRVSVLLPAPGVVDVIVPRTNVGSGGGVTFLARSTDGGRTFAPAVAIANKGFEQGVLGPGGRVALVSGLVAASRPLLPRRRRRGRGGKLARRGPRRPVQRHRGLR